MSNAKIKIRYAKKESLEKKNRCANRLEKTNLKVPQAKINDLTMLPFELNLEHFSNFN